MEPRRRCVIDAFSGAGRSVTTSTRSGYENGKRYFHDSPEGAKAPEVVLNSSESGDGHGLRSGSMNLGFRFWEPRRLRPRRAAVAPFAKGEFFAARVSQ